MFRTVLRQANFGLLASILLFFLPSQPAHADTLLVGTGLVSPTPSFSTILCPVTRLCNDLFSQFSTPQPFVVEDVKVDISGPILPFFPDGVGDGFHVSIITNPGSHQTVVGDVGSGFIPFNMGFNDQIFDFSGLSIVLFPGIEYYLEVTGGDLMWDIDTPVQGFGTLGLQLGCDRFTMCPSGMSFFGVPPLAEQISGSPVPEPSTWLLFATGLLMLCGFAYFNSGRKHLSLN